MNGDDGERRITLHPQREPGQRWDGTISSDPPDQPRHWCAGSVERVIDMMDADLGKASEADYQIVEGGA